MATLSKAIELAAKYHGDEVDKGGAPYILHPMRVANRCTSVEAQMVGWLHDTIEDTDLTIQDLWNHSFHNRVIEVVEVLSNHPGGSYSEYVIRCMNNPLAREVKVADLLDNLDASRLPVPVTERYLFNIVKYNVSLAFLTGKIDEARYLAVCAENHIK
jgi:hypothetical protein